MVSIILPVYNSENYIIETMESIINQTYTDWELIIVDDCSTDSSFNLINKYKSDKIKILQNEKRLGAAGSRNKAIQIAKGRFIAFIDSDDIWYADKLKRQINFMEQNNIAFSYTAYERINEKNDNIMVKVTVPEKVNYAQSLKNTIILNSTVVIDQSQINKELIKMPDIRICEDVATWFKILRSGIEAYGLNEYLTKYRVRKKSLSSNKLNNFKQMWQIYKDYEKLNFINRSKNFCGYIMNAIKKRIPTGILDRLKIIFFLINFRDVIDLFFFPIMLFINIFYKSKLREQKIWIIEENPNEACDNGYIFFKYIIENKKNINCYYVINKKSKNYKKVNKYGNVINHRSLKHWLYYFNAEKIIVTQKYANPSPAILYILHIKKIIKVPRIFLQHGITKDDSPWIYYPKTNFRIFICGAKREYEYVKEKFLYPPENVVYTGLARFDNLDLNKKTKSNMILVTPTWRKWIKNKNDDYFAKYSSLLNNKNLSNLLEKNNLTLNFILHKNMKKYKKNIKTSSNRILIKNNNEVDIQDLLNRSDMLITDFSSIAMDMAYMQKTIIYYQFDKNKYRQNHLQKGYYSYENDGFGDIITNENELIEKIKIYIENDFHVEDKYLVRMQNFFERRDKNNCERIFKEIEKI